jgi:hypothetical protein
MARKVVNVANRQMTDYVPSLPLDGWQSGRLRTLGKRVFLNRNPGFESLPIRKYGSATALSAGMRTLVRAEQSETD